jgi:outer membrane protein assembly factor BamB
VKMIRKLFISLLVIVLVGGLATGCALGSQAAGWSGVIVADGALFLGSMEGKLVAIDVASHNRLWSDVTLETSEAATAFGCAAASTTVAVYGTPAVSGDLVYVCGYNGKIYAHTSSSGALRWVYPREGTLESIAGGPVVAQGKVYLGDAGGKVYALDADTGDKEWEFETGDKIWSTPAIDGDTLYIGSFDKKLYAIEAAEGKKKWEFETEGAITCTPLVYNNTIYFGSFDRYFYAVDATDGSLRWQSEVEAGSWFWAKPVVYNNTIYAGNLDGKVYIFNADNGSEVVDAIDLESPISSSPVLVDDAVIIASEEGKVYSLDTGTNQTRLLANVEEEIQAPLYASEGVVYLHTQESETLYALNVQTGVTLWSLPLSSE